MHFELQCISLTVYARNIFDEIDLHMNLILYILICAFYCLSQTDTLWYYCKILKRWPNILFWWLSPHIMTIWTKQQHYPTLHSSQCGPPTAKGRTNVELREQFILAEGVSQSMTPFKSKPSPNSSVSSQSGAAPPQSRSQSLPSAGPIIKVCWIRQFHNVGKG